MIVASISTATASPTPADGPECEQQNEQGHGDGEHLGAVQIVVRDTVACVARRDVPGLLDRYPWMRSPDGKDSRAERVDGDRPGDRADDEDAVTVARPSKPGSAAELVPHRRRHVADGALERVVLSRQRVAVDEAIFTSWRPGARVLIHDRVAACRLADGAVLQRGRSCRGHGRDRERDESEPNDDRTPRVARAPPPDRRAKLRPAI
jgi:hypothetical protein